LFAGPHPIINPSGNFRRGHCAGYPWGLTFWVAPWLYKLFYKHYIIKVINFIVKFINPIVNLKSMMTILEKFCTELEGWGGGDVKAITRTASAVKNSMEFFCILLLFG
jgi:hypothetical protein